MNEKILFVDDDLNILHSFKRNLRKHFNIATASGGEEGLEKLTQDGPFAVVVSDMRMPGMNGTQFLSQVREKYPNTVRILLTGQADMKDAIEVVNQGQIHQFLTKPCPTETLIKVLQNAIRQYRLITAEKELLEKTLKSIIKILVDILAIVNPEAFQRTIRIHKLSEKLARRLNFKQIWQVSVAALLSQVGCVTIPVEILRKKNQGKKLTEFENQIYLKHIQAGHSLIKNIPRLEKIAEAIAYQEKRYNGDGPPPDKRKGEAIPFLSRILKVASDYDALIVAGNSPLEAQRKMHERRYWYDPEVLSALDAEILQAQEGYIIVEIEAKEIKTGMILADDVKTKYGALLIPKGHEISDILRMRILNFAETGNLQEPIRILKWVQKEN